MKNFKEFPCLKKLNVNSILYCVELSNTIRLSHGGSAGHIPNISEKSTH